jgi:Na+/H+ antiporter NhaD/arsenite permease-like protein
MFLFAKAGTIQYVGLTEVIADGLTALAAAGGVTMLIVIMVWLTGFTSAAMDNVVVVAAFLPVIHALTADIGSPVLYWALLAAAVTVAI